MPRKHPIIAVVLLSAVPALASQTSRFRPLCDADGYPLVGNLANKGDRLYQPSRFCAEVRQGRG